MQKDVEKTIGFPEVLSPIFKERLFSLFVIFTPIIQTIAYLLHLPTWKCPLKAATSLDCPGCGLTRSVSSLVHLEFTKAFHYNLFVLPLLLGWIVFTIGFFLPHRQKEQFLKQLGAFERKTGFGIFFFILLATYGILRNFF